MENNYPRLVKPEIVQMLELLFPGLKKCASNVPQWEDSDSPWMIFSTDGNNIIRQIVELTGSEEGVFIHPSADIGEFVKIEGPCYIGEKVVVRHSAYLRKGTWLCKGSLVGHSTEIKNSVLLPGSKAPHFNYVGDSIIGHGVNLGAGAKLSNVRNDRREIQIRLEDGTKVNTGLVKLGAIIGDGCQLGCNVVTNPGTLIPPNSFISPNESVRGWNST